MNITQFKQQYPQYKDVDDAKLSQALHQKYYTDTPFEQFDQRFRGVSQVPAPTAPQPDTQRGVGGSFSEEHSVISAAPSAGPIRRTAQRASEWIRERTGYFEPPVQRERLRGDQPVRDLGRMAVNLGAQAISGMGLGIPDVVTYVTKGDASLADSVNRITGFRPTAEDIKAGESARFITGLHTAGGVSGALVNRIAARTALKTILASGIQFGTRAAAEQTARKITKNEPFNLEGIHFEAGVGVLFGAGEAGVRELARVVRDVKAGKSLAPASEFKQDLGNTLAQYKRTGDQAIIEQFKRKYGIKGPDVIQRTAPKGVSSRVVDAPTRPPIPQPGHVQRALPRPAGGLQSQPITPAAPRATSGGAAWAEQLRQKAAAGQALTPGETSFLSAMDRAQPSDLSQPLTPPSSASGVETKPRKRVVGEAGAEVSPTATDTTSEAEATVSEPPSVPVAQTEAEADANPDQISFRNVDLEMRRKAAGLSPVAETLPRGTLQEKMQAAVDAGLADINTARHIAADILEKGRMATDLETHGLHLASTELDNQVAALEQQLVDFDADSADFKAASEAHTAAIKDIDLITRVGIETGTMWSSIGGARRTLLDDNGSYVGVLARAKKQAGRNLTAAEEGKLRGKVTDYRKRQAKARKASTDDSEVRMRKYVQRQSKGRKGPKLSKLGKLAKMTLVEKDAQLQDLLGRELTEVTLTDIFMNLASRQEHPSIDTTVGMVRQHLPNITHAQIMDAFDQLGRRKVRNTSAMGEILKRLKGQLRKEKSKLTAVDDILYWLNKGRLPDETDMSMDIDDRVVRDIQEVIEQAKKLQRDSEPYIQKKLEKQIQFLTTRLAAKDFGNKKQEFAFMPSRYTLELKYQVARLNAEIARDIARTKQVGPIRRVLGETARSVQAIKSSYDNSGLLNQGGFFAVGHPIRALKTLPKAIAAATSDRKAFMIEQTLLSRPNAPLYSRYDLGLTRATDASVFTQREEEFRESIADYIPGIRASNRMFATTLNILRADAFDAMAGGKDAIALGLSNVEGQAIADFVNMASGRGNIRGMESTVHTLNGVLWAPRRFISRFQMVATLGGQIEYGFKEGQSRWRPEVHLRGTKAVRRAMAIETARYLGGLAAIFALARLAGADFEWNPLSSDFLKPRWGNLRLDPLSGFAQTLTILSRFGTLRTKDTDGIVKDLSGYDADRLAQRFARYKLSPALGIAWSVLTDQTPFDGPLEGGWSEVGWVLKEAVVPISMDDILKAADDQGIPRTVIFSTLGLLGVGVQVYGDNPGSSGPRRTYGTRSY